MKVTSPKEQNYQNTCTHNKKIKKYIINNIIVVKLISLLQSHSSQSHCTFWSVDVF